MPNWTTKTKMTENEKKDILKHVDYTVLKIGATYDDVRTAIKTAVASNCASVCIPPCYVGFAKNFMKDNEINGLKICTVIGFPNGYVATRAKVFEVQDALLNGADEVDVVANIGWELQERRELLNDEVREIRKECDRIGRAFGKDIIFKLIVETSELDTDKIEMMCDICHSGQVDYIKTSTGFSGYGASLTVVEKIRDYIIKNGYDKDHGIYGRPLKIKASGGIRTFEDAERYLTQCGVDRIGTSGLR